VDGELNAEAGTEDGDPTPDPEPDPKPNREEELLSQVAEERENRIRLEERLRVQAERKEEPEPPKKVYTRQELRAAVTEGTIDDDQLEEIWAKQLREQTRLDTAELIDTRDRKRDTESFVDTETVRYLDAHPDVRTVGSSDWKAVKDEFDFFTKMGDPENKATELKALRAAFGSNPTRIPERTASHRETPADSSGSPGTGGGDRNVDIMNRIPKNLRPYYRDQLERGWKTMDEVKRELKYMKHAH
jgi:hypothetical protein